MAPWTSWFFSFVVLYDVWLEGRWSCLQSESTWDQKIQIHSLRLRLPLLCHDHYVGEQNWCYRKCMRRTTKMARLGVQYSHLTHPAFLSSCSQFLWKRGAIVLDLSTVFKSARSSYLSGRRHPFQIWLVCHHHVIRERKWASSSGQGLRCWSCICVHTDMCVG